MAEEPEHQCAPLFCVGAQYNDTAGPKSLTAVLELLLGQTNRPPQFRLQVVYYVATFAAGSSSGPLQKTRSGGSFCCDIKVCKQKCVIIEGMCFITVVQAAVCV